MDICRTLQEDCPAGLVRYGGMNECGFSLAKASRDAKAGMEDFLISSRQFLATVGDRNCEVLSLDPSYSEWDTGFVCRRTGDHLYVTEADPASGVAPGEEIYAVGDERIPDLRKKYGQNIFWENTDEREDWDLLLRMYTTMEIFPGDGTARKVPIRHLPKEKKEPVLAFQILNDIDGQAKNPLSKTESGGQIQEGKIQEGKIQEGQILEKQIPEGQIPEGQILEKQIPEGQIPEKPHAQTAYLRIDSFADEEKVSALIGAHEEDLKKSSRLILDLRRTEAEGEAESYLPLLPYLIDASVSGEELFPARTIFTSYTKQNAKRRIAQLEAVKEAALGQADSEEVISYADQLIEETREKAGIVQALRKTKKKLHERKQFNEIEEIEESPLEGVWIEKKEGPSQVLILTDVSCRLAGEALANAVRGQKRVSLVGRPTAGMLDYTNRITIDYDDIQARFSYPMSRTKEAREQQGFAFQGVPVDVYLPFTREECTKDLILEAALHFTN